MHLPFVSFHSFIQNNNNNYQTMDSEPAKGIFLIPQIQDGIFLHQGFTPLDYTSFLTVNKTWFAMIKPYLWSNLVSWNQGRHGQLSRHQVLRHAKWVHSLDTSRMKIVKAMAESGQCQQLKIIHLEFDDPVSNLKPVVTLLEQTEKLNAFKWNAKVLKPKKSQAKVQSLDEGEGAEAAEGQGEAILPTTTGSSSAAASSSPSITIKHSSPMMQVGIALSSAASSTLTILDLGKLDQLDGGMLQQVLGSCPEIQILHLTSCKFYCGVLNDLKTPLTRLEQLDWSWNTTFTDENCEMVNGIRRLCKQGWMSIIAKGAKLKKLELRIDELYEEDISNFMSLPVLGTTPSTITTTTTSNSTSTATTTTMTVASCRPLELVQRLELDYTDGGSSELLVPILETMLQLSALKLYNVKCGPLIVNLICQGSFSETLTELELYKAQLYSPDLQRILASCRNLKSFKLLDQWWSINAIQLIEAIENKTTIANWACDGLEVMELNFYLGLLGARTSSNKEATEQDVVTIVECFKVVFETLAKLKGLKWLSIRLWSRFRQAPIEESKEWDKILEYWKLLESCESLERIDIQWRLPTRVSNEVKEWTEQHWKERTKSVVIELLTW